MEFFTAFYIEYTVRGMNIQSYILLPSYEACQVMIRDNEDMSEYMFADGDVNMWCIKTAKLSQSIRPKLRPSTQSEAHQETDVCPQIDEDQCNNS
jgi:hypothetical protein